MQWDSGDLSLIKGVLLQEEAPGRAANQKHRSVLKHMRYDKDSGHFMSTEGYKVDHDNHRTLQEMLNNANGVSEADTGATVVCGGTGLMQEMGLKLEQLLPTNLTLFTADKKSLTVLGAVPVIISVQCEDGGTATTRDLLYIVEELSSVFISRDALSNLGIISKEFPKVHSSMSLGWVAGVQGSSADTAIEQPCIMPDNFTEETADC